MLGQTDMKQSQNPQNLDLLIVLPSLHAGGTERVASILSNCWTAEHYSVVVVCTESSENIHYWLDPRIVVKEALQPWAKRLRPIPGLTSALVVCSIFHLIRTRQPARVLSFLPGPNILTLLAGLPLGKKIIISERNHLEHRKIPWIWRKLRRLTYPKALKIIINLEANRDLLARWVDEKKIVSLPNPISVKRLKPSSDRRENTLLAVGRLTKQKAYHLLLTAFAQSECRSSGWRLVIIGEGDEKARLNVALDSLDIRDQVTMISVSDDIWAEYQKHKYFVMPSMFEGTPNSLLEAVACGMIPIVSDGVGDIADGIRNIEPRLVFPVNQVDRLVEILNLICGPSKLQYEVPDSSNQIIAPFLLKHSLPRWTAEVFGADE